MKSLLSLLLVISIATPAMAQLNPVSERQAAIQAASAQSFATKASNVAAIRSEILLYDAIIYAIDINQSVNARLGLNNLNPSEIAIPAAFGVLVADYFATKGAWNFLNRVTPQTSTKAWFTTLTTLERQAITTNIAFERAIKLGQGRYRNTARVQSIIGSLAVRKMNAEAAVKAHKATKPRFRMIGRSIRHTGKATVLLAGLSVFAWATSDAIVLQLPNDGSDLKTRLQNRIVRLEAAYESTITDAEINAVIQEEEKALDLNVTPVVSDAAVQADVSLQNEVALDIEAALKQAQEDAMKANETNVVVPVPDVTPAIEVPTSITEELSVPTEEAVPATETTIEENVLPTTEEVVPANEVASQE